MPRVWHQPSLGRENIWMFHHLEHGKCLGTISSCFQCYCGDTVLGVRSPTWLPCCSQHGLISSRLWYLAFFLSTTAVTLPSFFLKEELTLLSRAPDSSGSDSSAISSLCVFGLVDFPIKTYFNFRYARYAIKSDYLNLMFELCLRFFYLTSYLKQK